MLASIEQLHHENESKVAQLDASRLDEYKRLLQQNQTVQMQVEQAKSHIEQLQTAVANHEAEAKRDHYRDDCLKLEKRLNALRREREQLEVEASTANMDPQEARQKLMEKVSSRRHGGFGGERTRPCACSQQHPPTTGEGRQYANQRNRCHSGETQ